LSNKFSLSVRGIPQKLDPLISDEIYQIGREALANAFLHASATRIEIELTYSRREFQLRIADDGCGIDPSILDAGGCPGHWGLSGMRERAAKIHVSPEIRSPGGVGTEIALSVPKRTGTCRTARFCAGWGRSSTRITTKA